MLTRRTMMTTIAFASCLMASPGLIRYARAQADDRAVAFIKGISDQLVAIVNDEDTQQQKRRRLRDVIDASVDVDDIAHFCLGRFWRVATPDQQADYMALFHDLLVNKIASHLGDYQGVRVIMGEARASEDSKIVITKVVRPENPLMQVDWVISIATGTPRIVDLLAEGTSLRLTQRADFSAYLAHHQYSVQDLIDGMRHLIALHGS